MPDILGPWTLAAYFAAYILVLFVGRSLVVWRRTGVNPFVLPASDNAHGYVSRAFKVILPACAVVACLPLLTEDAGRWIGALPGLASVAGARTGWGLLVGSFAWIAVAQSQMGVSWRIGIDEERSTALVERGLFRISRNPIFLGMRVTLLGLTLVMPSAATLVILVAGEILIQVQVRLEETHLAAMHREAYEAYRKHVRRWI